MFERHITSGERVLLFDIFGWSLPYDDLTVDINDGDLGGPGNSITPAGIPFMSRLKWRGDYSMASVDDDIKGTFIHEMTHVWQYYHGISIGLGFIVAGIEGDFGFDYDSAYDYVLMPGVDFVDYNIEQQASIVADYWYILNGGKPKHNKGSDSTLDTYRSYIYQITNSGPPSEHPILSQLTPFAA